MAMAVVNDTELQELRGRGTPVVADFYADWCHPCHALAPELESLSAKLGAGVTFVKVDIDAHPELTEELGIFSVPTVVLFGPEGVEVARSIGAVRAEELALRLQLDA
ncbi:MAG: thioredoxin family protein [Actinomycetota bacterium]